MESSLCEKPERHAPRRLSDYLTPEGLKQKVHSLVDKVYSRKNLMLAWERVRANQGASGTDGITVDAFEANLEANLERLHQELRDGTYQPQPVRRVEIPKRGAPGKTRPLGIPSVFDRVCQQAMVNRLEPIFEKVFDPSSFGYRKGRKTADALGKIWREVEAGNEWIVDADLKDYFGSVDHEKLMALIGKQVADSRVLKLIQQTLTAGYEEQGRRHETPRGTPQGGVVSPLLSNILLTPFDKEMRRQGYQLTRWADDWVVTCRTRAEAAHALARAEKILEELGVTLNRAKTRIVHVAHGFEFLGFKIKRGKRRFQLSRDRIKSKLNRQDLYAIPTQKSVDRFKDQIRALTKRRVPLGMGELIKTINPVIRGWGNYFCRSHVRKLFHQLDGWIVRRLWSHRAQRWRNTGWKILWAVDSSQRSGRVELQPPTLETTMPIATDRTEAPTAIQSNLAAIFASLELSRSIWLITSLSPGSGEKISKHSVPAGDVAALLVRFAELKQKALARTGQSFPIVAIQEAGLDGFWLHRVLERESIESHVVDPASIATSRRRRRAKTDRIDGEALLRALLAYKRGEPRVCAMVRVPTPKEEDRRRLSRERKVLIAERVEHVNRIKGLLFAQGISGYEPLRRDRRQRLDELVTGDGRTLPTHLKTQINRELDRLELLLDHIKVVETTRDALLAEQQAAAPPTAGRMLLDFKGIGPEFASILWLEALFRHFDNRRQVASYAGLAPTPWQSGSVDREQGVSKAGNPRLRATLVELAWIWLRHQPQSALAVWFKERVNRNGGRMKKTAIVALARKLLVALWKYVTAGVVIEGAIMKAQLP